VEYTPSIILLLSEGWKTIKCRVTPKCLQKFTGFWSIYYMRKLFLKHRKILLDKLSFFLILGENYQITNHSSNTIKGPVPNYDSRLPESLSVVTLLGKPFSFQLKFSWKICSFCLSIISIIIVTDHRPPVSYCMKLSCIPVYCWDHL
jgi:hypothetical protein